jgi:hypothetical protein
MGASAGLGSGSSPEMLSTSSLWPVSVCLHTNVSMSCVGSMYSSSLSTL